VLATSVVLCRGADKDTFKRWEITVNVAFDEITTITARLLPNSRILKEPSNPATTRRTPQNSSYGDDPVGDANRFNYLGTTGILFRRAGTQS